MYYNFQPSCTSIFLGFHKNALVKSFSSFENLSAYKISWPHIDWCRLCINIKSLNICYFGMVKAMELGVASRLPSVARPAY
jgi:hypothetical protein